VHDEFERFEPVTRRCRSIAEQYLESATARQVPDLLAIENATTLAQVSTWADEIRPQRHDTARWETRAANGAALMRIAIARALLGLFVITTLGASLGACSHTWQGLKEDWHNNTGW
jgi:hypothetical protein